MHRSARRILRFGRFEFDLDQEQLYRSGLRVRLAPQPARLLGLLLERAGRIVTRDEIRDHLWPDGTWVDYEHGINQSIRRIRTVLGDDAAAARFVETVPRKGYRFFGGVERVAAASAGAAPQASTRQTAQRRGIPALVVALAVATALLLVGGIGVARRTQSDGNDTTTTDFLRLQRLTSNGATWAVAISPDGDRFAYAVPEGSAFVVRLKTLSSGAERRLVDPTPLPIKELAFSPDGRQVYFVQQETRGIGYRKLYRVATAGGEPEELVFDVDSGVASSPDGRRLAFVRGDPQQETSALIEVDADGRREARLAEWRAPDYLAMVTPAWSPDGKTVAVAVLNRGDRGGVEIVAVDVATGLQRPVGDTLWAGVTGLTWQRDSSTLLVSAQRPGTDGGAQLWRVDTDGGDPVRVSNDLNSYSQLSVASDGALAGVRIERRPPALVFSSLDGRTERWTGASMASDGIRLLRRGPDGGAIFTADDAGRTRLWKIESPGAEAEPLLPDSVTTLGRFAVSPDGEIVVYEARDVDGVWHLWTLPARGGEPRRLTSGRGEYAPAVCGSDGPVVFARDDADGLWAVDRTGTSPRQVSPLTPAGLPACAPDGKSVAMAILATESDRTRLEAVVVPLAGGDPIHRIQPFEGRELAWTPDGRALTFSGRPDSWHTVWRIALPSGAIEPLLRDSRGMLYAHDWTSDGERLLLNRVTSSSDAVLVSTVR